MTTESDKIKTMHGYVTPPSGGSDNFYGSGDSDSTSDEEGEANSSDEEGEANSSDEDRGLETAEPKCVALIVGYLGIVGDALVETLPDTWDICGISRGCDTGGWSAPNRYIHRIQCDISDTEESIEKLSRFYLRDITHMFYVASDKRSTEVENCEVNGRMLRNVLNLIIPWCPKLKHICLQTGLRHYTGPFEAGGGGHFHEAPFRENLPRLDGVKNFYYRQEDILVEEVKKKEGLTWSVHRPGIIFGFSPTSQMNLLVTLNVYASICKHLGVAIRFPGSRGCWEGYSMCSTAELVARHQIWAATEAGGIGKNTAFNVCNGYVFKWKHLWRVLTREYKEECPEYEGVGFKLEERMRDMGPVWDEMVSLYDLTPGYRLSDITSWWYADLVLGFEACPFAASMVKSWDYGFWDYQDPETVFVSVIKRLRFNEIIPKKASYSRQNN